MSSNDPKAEPRIGFEIFEDGTMFRIPPNAIMKPFSQWVRECLAEGKTVPTTETIGSGIL